MKSVQPYAVAFDYDGVIADSREVFQAALNATLTSPRWRLPAVDGATFRTVFDTGMLDGLARLVGLPAGDAEHAAFMQQFQQEQVRHGYVASRAFPGSADLLRQLARHTQVVIVSANAGEVIRAHLHRQAGAGLAGAVAIRGSEAGFSKVAKLAALRGEIAAARLYYVGDTTGDVHDALQAGTLPVAVTWGWHEPARFAPLEAVLAGRLFHQPADLLEFFLVQ